MLKIFRLILCIVFLFLIFDMFEERKILFYICIMFYYWCKMKDGFFRGKIFIVCFVNKIFCIIKIILEYIWKNFFFVVGIENKILYNLYLNCIFFD